MQRIGGMRFARLAALVLLIAAATSDVLTQSTSSPPAGAGPAFDVVSITQSKTTTLGSTVTQRPDGGITMVNVPVVAFIARAYPPAAPIDMVGLPGWARSERYDVSATSSLSNPTSDERSAMLRAMLADRFKLAVHFEKREQPAFDLVLARSDGRLGPGIKPLAMDCERIAAERAAGAARNAAPPPPQLNARISTRLLRLARCASSRPYCAIARATGRGGSATCWRAKRRWPTWRWRYALRRPCRR